MNYRIYSIGSIVTVGTIGPALSIAVSNAP